MTLARSIWKNAWWLTGAVYVLLLAWARHVPVFWDMYGQVKTAAWFLEHGFSDLFPDGGDYSDNGHMPLYPFYLAALFKLFGYQLWVAHFSVLPFLLGILWQLQRFARRYMQESYVALVLVLTLFHPAFLAQTLYFSQELAIVWAALWLINSLLDERGSHIALSSILLCLLNLRGISLCLVLGVHFVRFQKKREAWFVLCGILAWAAGVVYHYLETGWMFSGGQISEYRQIASFGQMLKNLALSLWKLADLGSVLGLVTVGALAFRKRRLSEPARLLLLASLAVLLTCVPFTNPLGNRYFLVSYVLLLPAFVEAVRELKKSLQVLLLCSFALVLFSNNGVAYPNRYGNAWDCSLKSLPYFKLRTELDEFVTASQIEPQEVEAGFQLYFNDRYYHMSGIDRAYALLSDTAMPAAPYVADSNISNNYNAGRERYLAEQYVLVKEFRRGAVYIRLYKRATL